MAVVPIRKYGDPVLREKALPVLEIDRVVRELAKDMADTMYNAPGAGLAATQVGVLRRMIIYDVGEGLRVLVNPEVVWASEEREEDEEGCLSFFEIRVLVSRPTQARVKATNLSGENIEILVKDLEARVLQHEIDHLDGIVILDRTTRSEKRKALQKMRELMTT